MTAGRLPARILAWLTLAAAGYAAVLVTLFFVPPYVPRYRLESAFMILVGLGGAAVSARRGVEREVAPDPASPSWHPGLTALTFGAVALLLYGPALGVGLLSDDFVLVDWVARGEWVHVAETGFVRPAVPLVWAALLMAPVPFEITVHAANVLLHAVNALLVVSLARRLGLSGADAVAGGLLFLTFPAFTEAVVWASGMQDVLLTTLVLVAVMATRRPVVAMGATVAALAVKETAVAVPLLALLVAWASPAPRWGRRETLTLSALVGVVLAYGVWRLTLGLPVEYGAGLSRYALKQLLVEPFATLGAPWSSAWMRAHPFVGLVRALVVLALVTAGVLTWCRRSPGFTRALALGSWVLVAAAPVLTFFHVSASLEGSRYVYLPAVGFSLLVAGFASHAGRLMPARLGGVTVAVVVAVTSLPSMAAIRNELDRWNRAAVARDAIVAHAIADNLIDQCGTFAPAGDADNVDGAFVFRNGLPQALAAASGRQSRVGGDHRPACRLALVGSTVMVTRE